MYGFEEIKNEDVEIAEAIQAEMDRQNSHIELIASENWVSKAVMAAMGSPLTNKYAEGYPERDITADASVWMLLRILPESGQKSCSSANMPTCSLIPEHRLIWLQCLLWWSQVIK